MVNGHFRGFFRKEKKTIQEIQEKKEVQDIEESGEEHKQRKQSIV